MPDEHQDHSRTPGEAPGAAPPQSNALHPGQFTEEAAAPSIPFQQLDPRVINLWRIQQLISSCVLLGLALVVCGVMTINYPPARLWALGGWLGLLFIRMFIFIWYPPKAYEARGYRIDQKVLESRRGVFFKVITLLPLSRLQHVDLNRGPMERMFGLASLVLYTAGTQHAMVIIPGLDETEAGRLRDHLVAVGGDDAV